MGFHPGWSEILRWIDRSQSIFIKKLSRNDSSWADDPSKHQSGFYIPTEIMGSQFFPALKNTNPEKPHIFDASYKTLWPATGETRVSTIKHYSNKGREVHHTGVPKDQFQDLAPASLLLSGKLTTPNDDATHWFLAIDSTSEESEIIENVFGLEADFHFGIFAPELVRRRLSDTDLLLAEILEALKNGTLKRFVKEQALPSPATLADLAQTQWLQRNGMSNLDPYRIASPGDAVMQISRDIEYTIYKGRETRLRAAQVADLLAGDGGDPIANMVAGLSRLDAIFLSASQTRKSRAGLSFEQHVGRMLRDGRISHQAQAVTGGRRPDFVLPSVKELNAKADTIILSLKTTLRERWKQLHLERLSSSIFLATVDDRVSGEAIREMHDEGIALVVPESLKMARETEYGNHQNVITFRSFFDDEIRSKRSALILPLT